MMEIVRDEKSPPSLVHLAFKILYIICRVSKCRPYQLFPGGLLTYYYYYTSTKADSRFSVNGVFSPLCRSDVIKSSCITFLMRFRMFSLCWTCSPDKIPLRTRSECQRKKHIIFLLQSFWHNLKPFKVQHSRWSENVWNPWWLALCLSDVGDQLHVAAVAVCDLPHTVWPVSSGWQSAVRWQRQGAHHGPHPRHRQGKYVTHTVFWCSPL